LRVTHFVVAGQNPHKQRSPATDFEHRYAMVVLATAEEKEFLPSLLESPATSDGPSYSIDTVRRIKRTLRKSDRLFFLVGIDAFLDVAQWRESEALLRECEFIVASRPRFSLADIGKALPESLRPEPQVIKALQTQKVGGSIVLRGATIHLLEGVREEVSATQLRRAAASGKKLGRFVPPAVADYIRKMHLYQSKGQE
jgi:nicotinate-nucleotide adenylyltransferase